MSSFGVYPSLTIVRLSLGTCSSCSSVGRVYCRVVLLVSWIPICCMFYYIFDPAIDRRIIYNDFRSNPYLHFDAGLVPRALGVQLGEFHCLFGCLLLFTYHA